MDGVVRLLLWQVLGAPVVSSDPTHAHIERITFSVSLEGGGVPSKWPSFQQQPHRQQQQRQRKLSDVGPLPSKALLAAMEACGAGGLADEMLALEHRGVKIWITADVPEGSQTSGHAVLRAVGTDMSCFTPALQQELQHFVVLSDRPKLRYGIVGAPEPPPSPPPPPDPKPPPSPRPSPPPPHPPPPPKPFPPGHCTPPSKPPLPPSPPPPSPSPPPPGPRSPPPSPPPPPHPNPPPPPPGPPPPSPPSPPPPPPPPPPNQPPPESAKYTPLVLALIFLLFILLCACKEAWKRLKQSKSKKSAHYQPLSEGGSPSEVCIAAITEWLNGWSLSGYQSFNDDEPLKSPSRSKSPPPKEGQFGKYTLGSFRLPSTSTLLSPESKDALVTEIEAKNQRSSPEASTKGKGAKEREAQAQVQAAKTEEIRSRLNERKRAAAEELGASSEGHSAKETRSPPASAAKEIRSHPASAAKEIRSPPASAAKDSGPPASVSVPSPSAVFPSASASPARAAPSALYCNKFEVAAASLAADLAAAQAAAAEKARAAKITEAVRLGLLRLPDDLDDLRGLALARPRAALGDASSPKKATPGS